MKLSASIMAHPDRHAEVDELLARLDRLVPVAWDDEGPPSGNQDRVWRTARRGWQLADPSSDFHLLLQDDAWPSTDLLAGLEKALDHVPANAVVSAYLGKGGAAGARWGAIVAEAERHAAPWIRSAKMLWGVAVILPVASIPAMIEKADRSTGTPDDMRVCGWAERNQLPVWYSWPSLVDHRQVPSLTKHRAKDRRAWRHHAGSALELDWSGPVVDDPMYARRNSPRSGPSRNRRVALRSTAGTGEAGTRA